VTANPNPTSTTSGAAPATTTTAATAASAWPDVLDPETAGRFLGIPETSVRELLRRGEIPGAKFGKLWRVARAALEERLRGAPSVTPTVPPAALPEPSPAWTPGVLATRRRGRPRKPERAAHSGTT